MARDHDARRLERHAQTFGDQPRLLGVARNDRGEFLAAEPADHVGGADVGRAVAANTCSASSPTAWPKRSLIDLNLSRSNSSTLTGWRFARALRDQRIGRFAGRRGG